MQLWVLREVCQTHVGAYVGALVQVEHHLLEHSQRVPLVVGFLDALYDISERGCFVNALQVRPVQLIFRPQGCGLLRDSYRFDVTRLIHR
jgi:hypothetical protein